MADPIEVVVRAGDCPCPGSPHTEEHIYLEPELTLPMASAGIASLSGTQTVGDVDAELTAAFLPRGIRSWSFLEEGEEDAKTKLRPITSVEITRESMERLLPFDRGGFELIEKAGELWMARFMRPLVERMAKLSERGQTGDSMSPSRESGPPRPARSKRSSRGNGVGKPFVAPAR